MRNHLRLGQRRHVHERQGWKYKYRYDNLSFKHFLRNWAQGRRMPVTLHTNVRAHMLWAQGRCGKSPRILTRRSGIHESPNATTQVVGIYVYAGFCHDHNARIDRRAAVKYSCCSFFTTNCLCDITCSWKAFVVGMKRCLLMWGPRGAKNTSALIKMISFQKM